MNATHFIEIFRSGPLLLRGPLCDIKDLKRNLLITANSPSLKTEMVVKINVKPGFEVVEGKVKPISNA